MNALADVLAVMDEAVAIRRCTVDDCPDCRRAREARAAVVELVKRVDQLLTGLAFPGLVKPSAKNANAGFVDMRDWYALQAGVSELRAALAKFGGAQ